MNQRWLKAAQRYDAAKEPGFKSRKKRPKTAEVHPSLAAFMANGEGEAACKLLCSSGQEICLGYSESVMSRTLAVIIDGEGLKTHSGVVGIAAAYTTEDSRQVSIDAERALELLRSFPEQGNLLEDHFDQGTLVANIRKRLDEIAEAVP